MATGAIVASTVLSAMGAVYSGSLQSAAAADQAKQAQLQGESSMIQSRITAAQMAKDAADLKGKQAVQAAANGMDLSSKSLIDLQDTVDKQSKDDISFTLSQGRMALGVAQTTASSYKNQASGFMTSGFLNAGSSLLGGAMKVGKVQGWEGFDKL